MKFLDEDFQKLEHEQDKHTHTHTDTDETERIATAIFAGGSNV